MADAGTLETFELAAWDRQIDADFDKDGRLRPILEEVRENIRSGRLEELP